MLRRTLKGAAISFAVAATVVAVDVGQAWAQLEEIVVTARKREEALQTVPLAITAFTSEDLAKRTASGMSDIARLTPGFSFEDFGGTGNTAPVIRGATQIAGSTEQPVSFFLDGVYLPRAYVTDVGFWGIERIEVVKGPQSARYGRNAFTGAVNYVTKKPAQDRWHVDAEGTAGIYKRLDGAVLVSGPLVADKVAVLGGVYKSTFDGSWKNLHPFCDSYIRPGTDCRVGGYDKTTYNFGVTVTPTDKLTLDLTYFNFKSKREEAQLSYFGELDSRSDLLNCGVYNPTVRPAGSGTGGGGQWFRLYCGSIPFNLIPIDPRGYASQMGANFMRVGIGYDISEAIRLDYTFGRVQASNRVNIYNDQLPGCPYFTDPAGCVFSTVGVSAHRTESHDIRLSYDDDGMITGAIGFLYSPSRDNTFSAFASAPILTSAPTSPLRPDVRSDYGAVYSVLGQSLTKNKIKSPFGEVQLSLMDKRLRIGVEGRWTQEERYQQALASGGSGGILATAGAAYNATYKFFTPRFTVDYDWAPDHLVYASVAKGVKSGGFNTTAFLPTNRIYSGDKNWTYELGTKNSFGALRLNADVFMIKWSNMQIPAADPGNPAVLPIVITLNLGNLTSKGFEGEMAYAFTENFTVNSTIYYGNSTYDTGTYHLNYARTPAICDNKVCPSNGYIGGKSTPRAPKWMGTVGAELTGGLTGSLDYYVRGDLAWQSKAYADEMNLAWVDSRVLVNANFGVTHENFDVMFWIRNLFDRKYLAVAGIQQPNVAYNGNMGDRRTAGVTLKVHY